MENKLSKTKIIQTAFQLLEETPDIEKLSMRKLAKKAGVQAPALYWYFENKQALLQSMAEEIENQFIEPAERENWKEMIFLYMEGYYKLYQQYPCALEIEMHTIPSSPARLLRYNKMLSVLENAGFSVEASYVAVSSLRHLLFGLLMDIHEEKQLYTKIVDGDEYLSKQVILMKQYVQENNLTSIEKSFNYRQHKNQEDTFKSMITLFLNCLETSEQIEE